jgi:tetratricopeptide (TPR) repeat protein
MPSTPTLDHVKSGLAAGLLALLVSSTAFAQSDYAECIGTPSDSDVDAAKGMHKAAEQYYAKARYDRAIQSWKEAYGFDCRAHPLLINIGNAYEKLGRTEEAIEAFQTYVDRMGDRADQTVVDKVSNLKKNIIETPDPKPVPDPDPYPPDPKPDPEPDNGGDDGVGGGPGPLPWVVVGIGAGVAVLGGALLGVGTSKESDAEAICPVRKACTDPEAQALGNEGLDFQRAGGALLGIGLAAVAGGVLWYFLDQPSDDAQTTTTRVRVPALLPSVVLLPSEAGVGFAGAGLTGSF